jgi:hypothetical protein
MPRPRWIFALLLIAGSACSGTARDDEREPNQPVSGVGGSGPRAPKELYDGCLPSFDSCADADATCDRAASGLGTVCAPACTTDADCPFPQSLYTGVKCTNERCAPFKCTSEAVDNAKLLYPGFVCLRGEVQSCAELDVRPCACGCESNEWCGDDRDCVPKFDDGENCGTSEHCLSDYCAAFGGSGRCVQPTFAECVLGNTECVCVAPAEGEIGHCLNACRLEGGDGTCVCPAGTTYSEADDLCRVECLNDGGCRAYEACLYPTPNAPSGYCGLPAAR